MKLVAGFVRHLCTYSDPRQGYVRRVRWITEALVAYELADGVTLGRALLRFSEWLRGEGPPPAWVVKALQDVCTLPQLDALLKGPMGYERAFDLLALNPGAVDGETDEDRSERIQRRRLYGQTMRPQISEVRYPGCFFFGGAEGGGGLTSVQTPS